MDHVGVRLCRLVCSRAPALSPFEKCQLDPRSFMSMQCVSVSECLGRHSLASSDVFVKEFARWYCKSRRGRLGPRVQHQERQKYDITSSKACQSGLPLPKSLVHPRWWLKRPTIRHNRWAPFYGREQALHYHQGGWTPTKRFRM